MNKNIYFLDFENLQSTEEELQKYIDDTCEIYLFHGVNQNNFPAFWVNIAIQLGPRLHVVQLKESANNALDFLIAYYIGKLSEQPNLHFHIISNDKGYDPLIDHLQEQSHCIERISRAHNLTPAKPKLLPRVTIDPELLKLAKSALSRSNRPSHREKLMNLLSSSSVFGQYKGKYALPEMEDFLQFLQEQEVVLLEKMTVKYLIPMQSSTQAAENIQQQIDQVLSPNMIKQIKTIFSKANRPIKEKSLISVIESSVVTQKDNHTKLTTKDVIQYLELSKTIHIRNGTVTYQTPITQPLLNQNYEKCQKILNKIAIRNRPTSADKYIASIKSWTKCTDIEAQEIFNRLQQKNKLIV